MGSTGQSTGRGDHRYPITGPDAGQTAGPRPGRPPRRPRCSAAWPSGSGAAVVLIVRVRRDLPARAGAAQRCWTTRATSCSPATGVPGGEHPASASPGCFWTTAVSLGDRHAARGAGRRRRRAVPHPLRTEAARRSRRAHRRPAGRGAVDHLRPVGPDRPRAVPAARSATRSAPALGWIPLFDPVSADKGTVFVAGGRAGHHDPADRHRDLPGGLRADPRRPPRGRARAGRDPVGDDPDRRAAVRALRCDQRLDARPRPGARRDHRGDDHPVHAGDPDAPQTRRSSPAARPSPARSRTTPRSSTARPRPAPSSPPAWCCSSSPSWSTRSPGSSSTAARPGSTRTAAPPDRPREPPHEHPRGEPAGLRRPAARPDRPVRRPDRQERAGHGLGHRSASCSRSSRWSGSCAP